MLLLLLLLKANLSLLLLALLSLEVHHQRVVHTVVQDGRRSRCLGARELSVSTSVGDGSSRTSWRNRWARAAVGVKATGGRRRMDTVTARMLRLALLVVHLTRWVTTSVLTKVDLESLVLFASSNGLDSLDSIGNVGEVDERAALLAQGVYQLDFTILGEVLSQAFFSPRLVEIADVDVARGTTAYSKSNGRRKGTRVLSPSDLKATVVNHQALEVAESVERGSRCGVDERHETDVLVGNVPDMMEQTTADDVADLLNCRLRVDVTQVNSAVTEIVHTSSGRGNGRSGYRLLGESVGDHVAVSTVKNVCVSRGNAKVLSSILLLCLRDICTAILAVIDTPRSLPLGLLRKLCNSLDSVTDRQEVNKTNRLLAYDLDSVDETELAEILTELVLGHIFRQIAQVDIAGGTRLLNGKRNGSRDLRRLAPTDLDVLTTNRQLFQDCVRVEMGGGAAVEEGNESTVLVGQEPDRFDLTTSYVAKNLLRGGLRRDVAQIDRPARSGDQSRGDGKR